MIFDAGRALIRMGEAEGQLSVVQNNYVSSTTLDYCYLNLFFKTGPNCERRFFELHGRVFGRDEAVQGKSLTTEYRKCFIHSYDSICEVNLKVDD